MTVEVNLDTMDAYIDQYYVKNFSDNASPFEEDAERIRDILFKASDDFIGKPNTPEARAALETRLKTLFYFAQQTQMFNLDWELEIKGENK